MVLKFAQFNVYGHCRIYLYMYVCMCIGEDGEVIVKIVSTSQKENGNQQRCGDKS